MTVLIFLLIVLICVMARYNVRLHCIVGSYPPAISAKQPPISTPGWHGADFRADPYTIEP